MAHTNPHPLFPHNKAQNPKACYNNKIEVMILAAIHKAITNPNYPRPSLRIKPFFVGWLG